jgi:hypothetical protein
VTGAGRCCPLHYAYDPAELSQPGPCLNDTVYVIGGLYGNPEALQAIERMRASEQRRGIGVTLVFNGDFHWFDRDPADFAAINETVLQHIASQGNVEAELAQPDAGAGCGCAYPPYVDDATVGYSNAIMTMLQDAAAARPALRRSLAQLPMYRAISLAGRRIGIIHGDPESLAGWRFAVEHMEAAADGRSQPTREEQIGHYFSRAEVDLFACSHTCLPYLQDFVVDGRRRLIANNGAAGMPNFRDTTFGLLTRISERPEPPADRLYGTQLGPLRVDALPIRYDHEAWLKRFLRNWPQGSPAHRSYCDRILHGPDFTPNRAMRCTAVETPPPAV